WERAVQRAVELRQAAVHGEGLLLLQQLDGAEEVDPILDDGAAHAEARLVAAIRGLRAAARDLIGGDGVEALVLQELERLAAEAVRAALGHRADEAGDVAAVLGR